VLLDELMPQYDVVERHGLPVRAAPEVTFDAIRSADLADGPITRALFAIRAIPATILLLVQSPRAFAGEVRARRRQRGRGTRLAEFERHGFRVVAERAPEELIIGLLGRFWTPRGGVCEQVSAATFNTGPPAGQSLAGWNFMVVPRGQDECELRTETRVWCAPDVRWKFRLYWMLVRPGSGLIRREMLRAIRKAAER